MNATQFYRVQVRESPIEDKPIAAFITVGGKRYSANGIHVQDALHELVTEVVRDLAPFNAVGGVANATVDMEIELPVGLDAEVAAPDPYGTPVYAGKIVGTSYPGAGHLVEGASWSPDPDANLNGPTVNHGGIDFLDPFVEVEPTVEQLRAVVAAAENAANRWRELAGEQDKKLEEQEAEVAELRKRLEMSEADAEYGWNLASKRGGRLAERDAALDAALELAHQYYVKALPLLLMGESLADLAGAVPEALAGLGVG